MIPGWDDIERREGFAGMRALVNQTVAPLFDAAPKETMGKEGAPKGVQRAMTSGFFLFVALFMSTFLWIPDTSLGTVARFILFPILFLGCMALMLWLNRGPIIEYVVRGEARLVARSEGVSAIANHVGLTYVDAPGGLPAGMGMLVKQGWVPKELKSIAKRIEERSGMEAPVEIAREAGVMMSNVIVLGTAEQKKAYKSQTHAGQTIEDGFHGVRNGIAFDMFEWVEQREDEDNLHHLNVVLKSPFALHGVTQVRARKTPWTVPPGSAPLQPVDLGPRAFNDLYRLRATDQVEARTLFNPAVMERLIALAHGDKFLGVAAGEHLVFDIAGANRFEFLSVPTGVWSDESIRSGLGDLIEALDLVDALAHAFMVARDGPAAL